MHPTAHAPSQYFAMLDTFMPNSGSISNLFLFFVYVCSLL